MAEETNYTSICFSLRFEQIEFFIFTNWIQADKKIEWRGQFFYESGMDFGPLLATYLKQVCLDVWKRSGEQSHDLPVSDLLKIIQYIKMMHIGQGVYTFELDLFETTFDLRCLHREFKLDAQTKNTQTTPLQIR
jgi:hypothetical protein